MAKGEPPKECPACHALNTLVVVGEEFHCTDPLCGRSIPIDPKGLKPPAAEGKGSTK